VSILKRRSPLNFGRLWIAPLLPGFLARYPRICIDAGLTDGYVDLVAEGLDVAIQVGMLKDSTLTVLKYLLLAAPGYLQKHDKPRSPVELADHACLGFTAHASWPDWPLRKGGSRHTVRPTDPLVADNLRGCCCWRRSKARASSSCQTGWPVRPCAMTGSCQAKRASFVDEIAQSAPVQNQRDRHRRESGRNLGERKPTVLQSSIEARVKTVRRACSGSTCHGI
jgi:hypothetical protein